MAVPSDAFLKGDVFIDVPQEHALFRFEKASGKTFRRFYGEPAESELERGSRQFADARIAGTQISAERYREAT
jgi:hypothetical protein